MPIVSKFHKNLAKMVKFSTFQQHKQNNFDRKNVTFAKSESIIFAKFLSNFAKQKFQANPTLHCAPYNKFVKFLTWLVTLSYFLIWALPIFMITDPLFNFYGSGFSSQMRLRYLTCDPVYKFYAFQNLCNPNYNGTGTWF